MLTAAVTDVGSASAHRNALWQVVQTCALAAAHLGSAFPCEEVILPRQGVPGSALIKSPRYRTEFLLTPLTAVAGLESPSVRWQGSSQLWNRAWKARSKVSASLGRHLPRTAIAMAVNSRTERSQDQFHIHIDCVAVSVEKKLVLKGPKVEGPWQLLPLALMGKRYWIKAVDKPDLETTNVVGIIASGLPQARRAMHHVNVVVVGAELAGARPGFYILTNWESSAAERLHLALSAHEATGEAIAAPGHSTEVSKQSSRNGIRAWQTTIQDPISAAKLRDRPAVPHAPLSAGPHRLTSALRRSDEGTARDELRTIRLETRKMGRDCHRSDAIMTACSWSVTSTRGKFVVFGRRAFPAMSHR
ncbi:CDP-diacylglycerol diphosphatase [Mesorhizobium sp. M0203]|uniref:CDP-diacylglycerol diphosphatase n=1 Tax=Mesorhizobium sp. M0203 TaxID=2956912 RepID=UPI00333B292D